MSTNAFSRALGSGRGTAKPDYFTTPDGVRLELIGLTVEHWPSMHSELTYRGYATWFQFNTHRDSTSMPWRCEAWLEEGKNFDEHRELTDKVNGLCAEIDSSIGYDGRVLDIAVRRLEDLHRAIDLLCDGLPEGSLRPVVLEGFRENATCETHCCTTHGCKYNKALCPVTNGWVAPRYPNNNGCEGCELDADDESSDRWA